MDPFSGSFVPKSPSDSCGQLQESTRTPSLLPAFEPLSSSPFPRPQSSKRKFNHDSPSYPKQQLKYYPTPVPTSSTGIAPSSPARNSRPLLSRTISTLSERVPLGDVPSVHLPANGEVIRMGRSSNSSDFQLSANRLISRVHVQAAYHAPTASRPQGYVEVECLGWNGAKIHCGGLVFDLEKGDSYVLENPEKDIMLDVQDTRVMIVWPAIPSRRVSWDSDDEYTPTRRAIQDHFASSPPMVPRSPVSQSPIQPPNFGLGLEMPLPAPVQVFEDADAAEDNPDRTTGKPMPVDITFIRPALSRSSSLQEPRTEATEHTKATSPSPNDFSDNDEENDPIVHSFGPFGENLLPRLAAFHTATPEVSRSVERRRRHVLTSHSPQPSSSAAARFKQSPVKNHVINQLAFSRLHSLPLSTIHGNLPAELKACAIETIGDTKVKSDSDASAPTLELSAQDLKKVLDGIACVGEIPRSGKDAAGKPLESEFYYVPEMDADEGRRTAVTGGMRGTGLRSVRKQHKQYYWKKPRV